MKKIGFILAAVLIFASSVSAHVVVKPAEVGVGAFQTFTMGVPNEKEIPTVGLRLVIPEGLNYVSPNVKPGWNVSVKKTGVGEDAKVTEITWTGGAIPEGQRDDFLLSAQVPAKETTLIWKAYQTYQDGTVVEWAHEPGASHNDKEDEAPPYSQTKIVNDLKASPTPKVDREREADRTLIYAALALGAASLAITLRNRK